MQLKNVIFTIFFMEERVHKGNVPTKIIMWPCFLPYYAYNTARFKQNLSNTSSASHTNYKLNQASLYVFHTLVGHPKFYNTRGISWLPFSVGIKGHMNMQRTGRFRLLSAPIKVMSALLFSQISSSCFD